MVAAGINDFFERKEGQLGQHITKGVQDLRAAFPEVQIAICTVPEVLGKGKHFERAVVATNKEIWRLGKVLGFDVVDINREVKRVGHQLAFERDGIHFNGRLGEAVGWRLAGRVTAFLGGSQKLRKME